MMAPIRSAKIHDGAVLRLSKLDVVLTPTLQSHTRDDQPSSRRGRHKVRNDKRT